MGVQAKAAPPPQPVQEETVSEPILPAVAKRLVELAVVEKKLVVVALVPVAFTKVKFWRVVEAVAKILAKVPRVVPVMLAKVGDAVVFTLWSNQSLRVGAPFTVKSLPLTVRAEVKRFVLDAVVEKKFVVVAEVPVAFTKVKFWRVEDEVTSRVPVVVRPVVEALPEM